MAFGAAAMDAAVKSSSVEEFMDNGNWGTVGSTILSGIVGVGYGCLLAGLQNSHPNTSSGSATSSPCDGTCFVAGTLVETENGSLPIEQITAGMMVYATDPETGETELKEVVNSFVRESSELVHITVNGEEITTTPTHLFWVPQKGWTDAIDLRAGDRLQLLNGEYVIIEQVQHEILEAPVATYNFEVEGFHTYYVGENDIFVHNKCFRGRLKDLTKYTDEMAEGFDAHHVFPQKFADEFSKIGVKYDNAKFGSWVDEGIHRGFSHEYNLDWDTFLHSVDGKLPTKSQTMKFGRMLAKKYGFDILF